jgi:hypothetical protein
MVIKLKSTLQPKKENIVVQPPAPGVGTPLKDFFSQYSNFQFQPSNSPVAEFRRLCDTYEWKRDSPEKKIAHTEFSIAMKKEFSNLYGSDEKDIRNWHRLCYVLRIDPVPETLQKCRTVSCNSSYYPGLALRKLFLPLLQAVLQKHVNLVDLVEGHKNEVQIFKTEKELSDYTRETGKFFPKEDAVDGGVLRALRRHILVPQTTRDKLR